MTCFVTAFITAKKEHAADLEAAALSNLAAVRAEDGCLSYEFHRSADTPGAFLFYEAWRDRAALTAHAAAPHMQTYREKIKDFLAAPTDVHIWEKL